MTPVLQVEGLCKRYPNFTLGELSFTVEENCITGFIGKNGAGKTTTLRCILGLAKKDGGTIRLFGQDVDQVGSKLLDRVSVVLDEGQFFEDLSMRDMKKIVASAYSQWSDKTYLNYLERMGLDERQKIKTLSRGMKMKYSLALALSHNADLLIMDEPTSGLDPKIRRDMVDTLSEYVQQQGKSVLFSTHITSDLERAADTLIMVDSGKVIFSQDKEGLLDSHRRVKGDPSRLDDPELLSQFLAVERTPYAFTGLTAQPEQVRKLAPDLIFERPGIEEIMLAYIN